MEELTERTCSEQQDKVYAPEDHASRRFTFESLKKNMDKNGVITINRQDPVPKAVNGEEAAKLVAPTDGLKVSEQPEAVNVAV